jgi:hypothetical protein
MEMAMTNAGRRNRVSPLPDPFPKRFANFGNVIFEGEIRKNSGENEGFYPSR